MDMCINKNEKCLDELNIVQDGTPSRRTRIETAFAELFGILLDDIFPPIERRPVDRLHILDQVIVAGKVSDVDITALRNKVGNVGRAHVDRN